MDRALYIFSIYSIICIDPVKENVVLQTNRNLSLLFLLRKDLGGKNQSQNIN